MDNCVSAENVLQFMLMFYVITGIHLVGQLTCKLVFVSPFQIYNKVKTGDQLKVEHVVSVLEKQYPYVEVNSILGIDSAYDQNRKVRI